MSFLVEFLRSAAGRKTGWVGALGIWEAGSTAGREGQLDSSLLSWPLGFSLTPPSAWNKKIPLTFVSEAQTLVVGSKCVELGNAHGRTTASPAGQEA